MTRREYSVTVVAMIVMVVGIGMVIDSAKKIGAIHSAKATPLTETGNPLVIAHDDVHGVTCWRMLNMEGISCLPDTQLHTK